MHKNAVFFVTCFLTRNIENFSDLSSKNGSWQVREFLHIIFETSILCLNANHTQLSGVCNSSSFRHDGGLDDGKNCIYGRSDFTDEIQCDLFSIPSHSVFGMFFSSKGGNQTCLFCCSTINLNFESFQMNKFNRIPNSIKFATKFVGCIYRLHNLIEALKRSFTYFYPCR